MSLRLPKKDGDRWRVSYKGAIYWFDSYKEACIWRLALYYEYRENYSQWDAMVRAKKECSTIEEPAA